MIIISWGSPCMFTHTQFLIISFNLLKAFLLRSSSDSPMIWPQKPSVERWACLDKALAPTVSFGGLVFPSSCFALKTVNRLLKLSNTEVKGGGQTSLEPIVFLIPKQVKNPRGFSATNKSFISKNKLWLSLCSKASKTSSTWEVSFDKVSISKWVSSWSSPGHFLYLIGKT